MANVHVLPGIERRDLVGDPVSTEDVFKSAIARGVTDVVVVGRDRKGELYVAGAPPDVDRTVGILMRAVNMLSGATIRNDVVITTDPPPEGA